MQGRSIIANLEEHVPRDLKSEARLDLFWRKRMGPDRNYINSGTNSWVSPNARIDKNV